MNTITDVAKIVSMSRRRGRAVVSLLASLGVTSTAPCILAEAPAAPRAVATPSAETRETSQTATSPPNAELEIAEPGMVLVSLSPSQPEFTLRLNSFDGSPPLTCNAPCTVRVRTGVPYELAISDRRGASSRQVSFSQRESLLVSPPNRAVGSVGTSVLIGGGALFVVSTVVFGYGLVTNLSLMECEGDCDAVSPFVVKAALVGVIASVPLMFVGGALMLGNSGPDIRHSPFRVEPEPSVIGGRAAVSIGAESPKRVYEPALSWRVTF